MERVLLLLLCSLALQCVVRLTKHKSIPLFDCFVMLPFDQVCANIYSREDMFGSSERGQVYVLISGNKFLLLPELR